MADDNNMQCVRIQIEPIIAQVINANFSSHLLLVFANYFTVSQAIYHSETRSDNSLHRCQVMEVLKHRDTGAEHTGYAMEYLETNLLWSGCCDTHYVCMQFQSFSQYRCKVAKKKDEELDALRMNPKVYIVRT